MENPVNRKKIANNKTDAMAAMLRKNGYQFEVQDEVLIVKDPVFHSEQGGFVCQDLVLGTLVEVAKFVDVRS
jgi:hypothetical protein